MWILKIAARDRGEGIKVVRELADIPQDEHAIIQEYVQYPYVFPDQMNKCISLDKASPREGRELIISC